MKELVGTDLFDFVKNKDVDAICITTNCSVSNDGTNPMGGGCAGAAARRWKELPEVLGQMLSHIPSVPCLLGYVDRETDEFTPDYEQNAVAIWAYPTMHEIGTPADLRLVTRSAALMKEVADIFGYDAVLIPRPGAGIGGLDWETEVKPALAEILDGRFFLVHKDGK